jgi:SOS-response transcriptional repressor LexA
MRAGLTAKQREVYEFIVWFIDEHGHSPSFTEIVEAVSAARSGVSRLVDCLEERGVITRLNHCARSISIVGNAA